MSCKKTRNWNLSVHKNSKNKKARDEKYCAIQAHRDKNQSAESFK